LPVPGAGLTFSTPVSELLLIGDGDVVLGPVAEAEFVDCEFLLAAQPAKETAAITEMQATNHLLKFIR
jgi:hypothetical protein